MKIVVNRNRVLHLLLLIVCSHIIARFLINSWEWAPLSAYGLACTIATQFSNAIISIRNGDADTTNNNNNNNNGDGDDQKRKEKRDRIVMRRRERKSGMVVGTKRK